MKDTLREPDNTMEVVTDEINVTKSKEVNSSSNESHDTLSNTDMKKETDNVLSSFEEALVDDLLDAVKNESAHDRDTKLENKEERDLDTEIAANDSAKTTSTKDDAVIESGEANGKATQEGQTNHCIEAMGQENALLKRKKRTRMRPSKRRRLAIQEALTKEKEAKEGNAEIVSSTEQTIDTLSGDVEYCLTVTNLPNSWSFMDIKNYVDLQCGPVDEIEMIKDDDTGIGAIRLSYQVLEDCETAMAKLAGKEIEGNKLTVSMSVVDLSDCEMLPETPPVVESKPETKKTENVTQQSVTTQKTVLKQETVDKEEKPPAITTPWKPDLDMWEIDPNGTYGLKESFLASIGITPPLDKWVQVSNFRCDKADLRDAMEIAGRVVMCAVFYPNPKYANVMYSHPLEAVQAVTLLNGQDFYGKPLKVVMERSPANTLLLPKGLNTIGLGLGARGKPQRNIVEHYQRYVTNKSSMINLEAFEELPKNDHLIVGETFQVKRIESFEYVVPKSEVKKNKSDVDPPGTKNHVTKPKPIPVTSKAAGKTVARSSVRTQGPQNFGPNFGPRPAWNGPGPGHGPRPIWNGPGPMRPPGPMGGPMHGPRPMGPMGGPMQGPMPGPMQGPMRGHMQSPMSGPMQGPMQVPMQGNMQGPMQGTMQAPMQSTMQAPMQSTMQAPMQVPTITPMQNAVGQIFDPNQPVQLQLSNLPPSTTFAILCEKMASCGQVVSLQLTTPGAAVVTFANKMQADYCYTSYNNMCIEGYYIQVNYGS